MKNTSPLLKTAAWIRKHLALGLLLSWMLWSVFVLWLALPVRFPVSPEKITFGSHTISVTLQESTAPNYRVVGGAEELRIETMRVERLKPDSDIAMQLNTSEVELIGVYPSDYALHPAYALFLDHENVWVLSGHVVGVTARWVESLSGVVPIFFVESCRPTTYIPNIDSSGTIAMIIKIGVLLAVPILVLVSFLVATASFMLRSSRAKSRSLGR